MADIVDIANDENERWLTGVLLNKQRSAKKTASGTGSCFCCGSAVEGERRWCDAECRDEWQQQQKRGR